MKHHAFAVLTVLFAVCTSWSAQAAQCGADDPACTGSQRAEEPQDRAQAQLPMTVRVEANRQSDGVVHLVATVRVSGRLESEVWLRVELSDGAVLVVGELEENLGLMQPDTVTKREFDLLPGVSPVRIVAVSTGQAMGATAWDYWPAAPDVPHVVAPEFKPVAPVKFMGITIDKGVEIR